MTTGSSLHPLMMRRRIGTTSHKDLDSDQASINRIRLLCKLNGLDRLTRCATKRSPRLQEVKRSQLRAASFPQPVFPTETLLPHLATMYQSL